VSLTEALFAWFDRHRRMLPWRASRTPYRVWLAEVMLQQTQVKTVAPYFERFVARFPHLRALAAAPLDEVLKLWEGLGYYRRARLMHQAAKVIVEEQGGKFPTRYADLLRLPGVGRYTAAAVASIAFGERVLAVDGNVRRVAARLFMLPGRAGEAQIEFQLAPHLSAERPGDFNEALMELGATVCLRRPACSRCPLTAYCQAFQSGRVKEFPTPKPKRAVPHHRRYALVHVQGGAIWLYQRGEDEMLGGLWGVPLSAERPRGRALGVVKHAYTHFTLAVTPVLVPHPPERGEPVPQAKVAQLALSTLDRKVLGSIEKDAKAAEHAVLTCDGPTRNGLW
jgi:A/G-specific adenine glycosylase